MVGQLGHHAGPNLKARLLPSRLVDGRTGAQQSDLLRLINGMKVSQVIYALVTLGIPDLLGEQRKGVAEIAEVTNANPPALYRLLRAAAAVGVLDEDDSKGFAVAELGVGLRSDVEGSVAGWVGLVGSANYWQNWGQLADSIRTGETGWRLRHGVDAWTYRAEHPEDGRIFDLAMVSLTAGGAKAIAGAYDFSPFRTVVDVGGGRGSLLAEILHRTPGSTGVLFDQPHVVEGAAALLREAGLADRCRIEGGSFFESVPAGEDAYILKSIIHDWYDPEARQILQVCRRAASPASVLLIAERVLDPPNQGMDTKLSDLNMLVNPGGLERSEPEFATLLASSGFKLRRVVPTSGPYCVIEAVPA